MAKPGPKPKGEFSSKGATLSARITVTTRRQLEVAARASDNSISEEVELRLKRSFEHDTAEAGKFGLPQTYALLRLVAEAIDTVEQSTLERWYEDRFAFLAMVAATTTLIGAFQPKRRMRLPAAYPAIPHLDTFPDAKRAVRKAAAERPLGEVAAELGRVAAQTAVALMQASPETAQDHMKVYRKAADKLLKRLTKPVLPLPPTPGLFRDPHGREWGSEEAYREAQRKSKI